MAIAETCSHASCNTLVKAPTFGKTIQRCHQCNKPHCEAHRVPATRLLHLANVPADTKEVCHSCVAGIATGSNLEHRLWDRCLKDSLCAFRAGDRYCPESANQACACCGLLFCGAHSRSLTGLDATQRQAVIKHPKAGKLCVNCHRSHLLEESSFLLGSVHRVVEDVDFRLTRQMLALQQSMNTLADESIDRAKNAADDAVDRAKKLGTTALDEANNYVTRLAVAGLSFLLIYLLAPHSSKADALTLAQKGITFGGLAIGAVSLASWLKYSFAHPGTRSKTILLIAGGLIVPAFRFFVEKTKIS